MSPSKSDIGFFIAMITFEHVTYSYNEDGSSPVLNDISLVIQTGEEIAIMGANGCGKTTFGMLLSGIIQPQQGDIRMRFPDSKREKPVIGFLFQDPDNGLIAMTVEREVAFALENQNMPSGQIREIVEKSLREFGLDKLRTRVVWELSGGEKQRLSLAGVIALSPDILFLDEPASFLDYQGALQLELALKRTKEANPNLTIIRVTQFLSIAEKYGRVLIMGDGKILKDGKPGTLFQDIDFMRKSHIRPPLSFLTLKESTTAPKSESEKPDSVNSNAVISVSHVLFAYDSSRKGAVLRDVSFEIYQNEILALVGPSGCGKSTLAQILCGIYAPSSGDIRREPQSVRMTMSFQQPERQFFCDTVYDEVAYGVKRQLSSDSLIDARVRMSLAATGLDIERYGAQDPHFLSGGEARKLAFAIIIALDADILIFDEPTCGLDDLGISAFLETVRELRDDGKTIVLISHDSNMIGELSDRVAMLQQGVLRFIGNTQEYFLSGKYEGILEMPEVMHYQLEHYGKATTVRGSDLFL